MNNQTIRALRKKLGLSQRQFAERLGVKRRTIIRWESGIRTPNQEFRRRLSQLEANVTDGNVTDGNVTDQNVTDQNVTDENVTDENVTDQNVTDQNVTDENVTDENVTDQNVTDENVNSESEQSSKVNSDEQVNSGEQASGEQAGGEQVNKESVNSGEGERRKAEGFLKISYSAIPDELKALPQWCCWRKEIRKGRPTKVPVDAKTGQLAESDNPDTWSTFPQAISHHEKHKEKVNGIGFFFSDSDPYTGIDLDKCIVNGELAKEAQAVVFLFDSYTERSISGEGLHIIIRGVKPGDRCKADDMDWCDHVEMYDKLRYFALTGDVYCGYHTIKSRQKELNEFYNELFPQRRKKEPQKQQRTRPEPNLFMSDQELIEKAMNSKNGAKFTALWNGDFSGYESHSEGDLALCCLLAFWTGGDYDKIDRLFRQSGLYREKWERENYRSKTINKALENTTEFYDPTDSGQVQPGKKPHHSNTGEKGKRANGKDASLKQQITKIRARKGTKAFFTKQIVSGLIINDMKERGKFYQTRERLCYFFDENQKALYLIGDDRALGAQIEDTYGINPSEQEYSFLIEAMITETLTRGELTTIHQFAFYDKDANKLYVYNNDNGIYKLDGKDIQLVDNGTDQVLFLGDELCEPFEYADIGDQKFLDPLIIDPINFSSGDGVNLNKEEQQWLLWTDLHTKFFETLLPTKPIVAFIGPSESGKSMAQRLIMKVLFGSGFDVTMISKEDDFDAAVTANYTVAFDNVDGEIDWLNDRLAHTATGKMIQKRELYTTNRNIRYFPKCFLMLNARSPRFKREDVTNRLLLFRTEGIDKKRSEGEMIDEVMDKRNEIWSELLNVLNIIVRSLATETRDFTTAFRMADWAKLAWQIERMNGYGEEFLELLSKMDRAQSEFLLEDDSIFLCLSAWLAKPENVGREVKSSTLFNDFQLIAQEEGISFTYKNTKSFGRRLRSLIDDLREFFEVRAEKRNNQWTYIFRPKT